MDGMLVVASAAMVEDKRAGRSVRWSARIAFTAGMAACSAATATSQPASGSHNGRPKITKTLLSSIVEPRGLEP